MDHYTSYFADWNYSLLMQQNLKQSPEFCEEELKENDARINKLLYEMLSIAQKESGVKANFSSPQVWSTPLEHSMSISSGKLKLEFVFGVRTSEFYLEASFNYPEQIGKVDDQFWLQLAHLSSLGNLQFNGSASPDTKLSRNLRKKNRVLKSTIFEVIQHYIVCADDECFNDGALEISWGLNTDFSDLLASLAAAFSCVYKMNYQLYRRHYIIEKSRQNRN
ncbi:hypothetical protein ACW9OX_004383 [Vibrio vulnificus]